MNVLYHLSHFFEFLAGIYFGGFALLNFLQKDASNSLSNAVEKRELDALNAKAQVTEYFKIHITTKNGPGKLLRAASKYAFWCKIERNVDRSLKMTNFLILDIVSHEGFFIKRFFPSFFFNGCFCLAIILFSGYEEINTNPVCRQCIDYFFIYFVLSTFIFQCWALLIFPFRVEKWAYLYLTLLNVFFCGILFIASEHYAKYPKLEFGLQYFLLPTHKDILISIVILLAVSPLVVIILFCFFILILWVFSSLFYDFTLWKFEKNTPISELIQKLDDD